MELIREYLPILIPIVVLEVGLMVYALRHLLKHNKYKFGNKIMWIVIVVLIQIIGPVLYLTIGTDSE